MTDNPYPHAGRPDYRTELARANAARKGATPPSFYEIKSPHNAGIDAELAANNVPCTRCGAVPATTTAMLCESCRPFLYRFVLPVYGAIDDREYWAGLDAVEAVALAGKYENELQEKVDLVNERLCPQVPLISLPDLKVEPSSAKIVEQLFARRYRTKGTLGYNRISSLAGAAVATSVFILPHVPPLARSNVLAALMAQRLFGRAWYTEPYGEAGGETRYRLSYRDLRLAGSRVLHVLRDVGFIGRYGDELDSRLNLEARTIYAKKGKHRDAA